jgi:hypothetical protein
VLKSYKRDPARNRSGARMSARKATTTCSSAARNYMLSADGYLMPAKKGQQPPDLRYFNQAKQ